MQIVETNVRRLAQEVRQCMTLQSLRQPCCYRFIKSLFCSAPITFLESHLSAKLLISVMQFQLISRIQYLLSSALSSSEERREET